MVVLGTVNGDLALSTGSDRLFTFADGMISLVMRMQPPLYDGIIGMSAGPLSSLLKDINSVCRPALRMPA
jgi:hypothetical protein